MPHPCADALLAWFEDHARRLPWREHDDPYSTWVSEVMLQQTRVETVIPYFRDWMTRFPDVETLAKASRAEVLKAWEGLGYYRRAHKLHQAARKLADEKTLALPQDEQALMRLPGIGPYTAAAIQAIAFQRDTIALDGNLRRVISRLSNLTIDPRSREGEARLRKWAMAVLTRGKASEFNQALMDLGAMVCTPKAPRCSDCPLSKFCEAYRRGVQEDRPVRKRRRSVPHHDVGAAVIGRDGEVLIARRPMDGLLGGLWAFPGGRVEAHEAPSEGLKRFLQDALGISVDVHERIDVIQHAYTHLRITLHAFQCVLVAGIPGGDVYDELRWVSVEDLPGYAMGKADRSVAQRLK